MTESLNGGAAAAPLSMRAAATITSAAVRAARQLLTDLERGRRIDAALLRGAMEAAFGASDAAGAWNWKTAYDTCEAATVLFLRKFGPAIRTKAGSTAAMLPMLARVASLLPTHTRRSEDSQALQQFSTPIPLGLAACTAAAITPADRVLEPSAGTGLLAIFAELAGGGLILNELAEPRAELLDHLFATRVTRLDAAQINDHLDAGVVPSVVVMNRHSLRWGMSIDEWRTQRFGISLRRWRAFATEDVWLPLPARTLGRTVRHGEIPSFVFRNAGELFSRLRSMAPCTRSTELKPTQGCL